MSEPGVCRGSSFEGEVSDTPEDRSPEDGPLPTPTIEIEPFAEGRRGAATDSETESLLVHAQLGDAARLEDLLSETESDWAPGSPTRARTRLLSRSHSAEDLRVPSAGHEPPRRNSSGEFGEGPPPRAAPSPAGPWREDDFSLLLQATAERVLSRLKSRQREMGPPHPVGPHARRAPFCPAVPRKLQPIARQTLAEPREDFGPQSAA